MLLFFFANPSAADGVPSNAQGNISRVLPVSGWQIAGGPYHYSPATLYEYINGAAEFYIAYGFVELVGADYLPVHGGKDALTVDVYDMGRKLNAFGLFQARRGGATSGLNIGAASYVADGYLAFYKDRFYVEIEGLITKEPGSAVQEIGTEIAKHIPGDGSIPVELSLLPEKDRIFGSERYVTGGILGHAFLSRGIVSEFRAGNEKLSAFIGFFRSRSEAAKALEIYRAYLQGQGRPFNPLDNPGQRGFISHEPYHKTVIVAEQGPFVVGVYDALNIEAGKQLLSDILITSKARAVSK